MEEQENRNDCVYSKQLRRFVILVGFAAEELISFKGRLAAAGSADQELLAKQERLDFITERVDSQIQGGAESLNPGWAAAEDVDQDFQVTAILLIQSFGIDFGHGQGGLGEIERDLAIRLAGGVAARPIQTGVGGPRCAPATAG